MRVRLLFAFALCVSRRIGLAVRAGAADVTASSFSALEKAVAADDDATIISIVVPEIRFAHQLDVRSTLTIESTMAATLSGGNNSTRLFLINNHSKLSLRGLNLAHGHEAGQHFGDGSSFGGAIFVSHAGALILDSVSITAS